MNLFNRTQQQPIWNTEIAGYWNTFVFTDIRYMITILYLNKWPISPTYLSPQALHPIIFMTFLKSNLIPPCFKSKSSSPKDLLSMAHTYIFKSNMIPRFKAVTMILYIYIYNFVWRRHENMSPCTGSRMNSNYERNASRVGAQFRTRASESQRHFPPPTLMSNVQRYSVMTRPSKTDWHQLNGITL